MYPVTREEIYLDAIATGDASGIPSLPVTRKEVYLDAIATGDASGIPSYPVTREERYLDAIATGDASGIPSYPVDRVEMYLDGIATKDKTGLPTYPVTREEMFLAEWAAAATELPAAYKRQLGFTFDNNAYYAITDFKMSGSDTLRFSFKCTQDSPACNVLGAYDGTSATTNYSLYVGSAATAKYLRYADGTYESQAVKDKQYDVVITPTGSSGMEIEATWTALTFESSGDLNVGTTSPSATSSKMVGDIIGNVEVDGRLKLIPCERVSDSVLGYYDAVSDTFYEPTGSGVISLGDA